MELDPLDQSTQTWRPRRGRTFKIIVWTILALFALSMVVIVAAIVMNL